MRKTRQRLELTVRFLFVASASSPVAYHCRVLHALAKSPIAAGGSSNEATRGVRRRSWGNASVTDFAQICCRVGSQIRVRVGVPDQGTRGSRRRRAVG